MKKYMLLDTFHHLPATRVLIHGLYWLQIGLKWLKLAQNTTVFPPFKLEYHEMYRSVNPVFFTKKPSNFMGSMVETLCVTYQALMVKKRHPKLAEIG